MLRGPSTPPTRGGPGSLQEGATGTSKQKAKDRRRRRARVFRGCLLGSWGARRDMPESAATMPPPRSLMSQSVRAVVVAAASLGWLSLFWFVPPRRAFPAVREAAEILPRLLRETTGLRAPWIWVLKSWLLAGVVVLVVALVRGRRGTGLGLPNATGLRLVAAALLVALPFQVALGLDPQVAHYYRQFLGPRAGAWIVANVLVMIIEHLFVEGAVLALALPDGFPRPDERPRRGLGPWRALGRLGLGRLCDPGAQGPRTFWAIPVETWPAVVATAVVFGCIHFTKAPSELVTAFPGGLAVGWLTARTGSVWPAALMHLITSAVVTGTLLLAQANASV
jgi:hypothetical protein